METVYTEIEVKVTEFYKNALAMKHIDRSEKQCAEDLKHTLLENHRNTIADWLIYGTSVHDNPFLPKKTRLSMLYKILKVESQETKAFLADLVSLAYGHYDMESLEADLIKAGLKYYTKRLLNTRKHKGYIMPLRQAELIIEGSSTAHVMYYATYIYLLNRYVLSESQEHSRLEGLNAYLVFLSERQQSIIKPFFG